MITVYFICDDNKNVTSSFVQSVSSNTMKLLNLYIKLVINNLIPIGNTNLILFYYCHKILTFLWQLSVYNVELLQIRSFFSVLTLARI